MVLQQFSIYNIKKYKYKRFGATFFANTFSVIRGLPQIEKKLDSKNLETNYKKILTLFSPAIPHFVSECLEDLKVKNKIIWPNAEEKYLSEDKIDYVIQINGKKRAILKEKRDLNQESLLNKVKSNNMSEKYLKNKSIKKVIFVKNRLINLLVND